MAKKPSNQIIDIIENAETDPHTGAVTLTSEQATEVIRLCKVTDKRDQELRQPRKKAKRATR